MSRSRLVAAFALALIAPLAAGCGGGAAQRAPADSNVGVAVDGDKPGRPGCLDCVVRVCSSGGDVDTVLLELEPPTAYSDVTFTSAQFRVTTPAGVSYGTFVDPNTVGDPPISLEPKDFPTLTKEVYWTASVSEVDVKYVDKNGVLDGETWSLVPKTDGCDP